MKISCVAFAAAALLAVGCAQAQLLDLATPSQLEKGTAAQSQPFAGSFRPFPRPYQIETEKPIWRFYSSSICRCR
jgi:hypothetical protein